MKPIVDKFFDAPQEAEQSSSTVVPTMWKDEALLPEIEQSAPANPVPEEMPKEDKVVGSRKVEEEKAEQIGKPEASFKLDTSNSAQEYTSIILNSDIADTPEKTPNMLLNKLLSFLASPAPLNPVLVGYFSKVFNALLEKHKNKLLEYLFRYKEHVDHMTRHVYNPSLSDNLANLLINEEGYTSVEDKFLAEKEEIANRLILQMGPGNTMECVQGSCHVLCKLVLARQSIDYFTRKEVIKKIFGIAKLNESVSLRGALTLIKTIYQLKKGSAEDSTPCAMMEDLPDLSAVVKISVSYLSSAKEYLATPKKDAAVQTPYGSSVKPFGLDRLKVVEWLHSLVVLREASVCERLEELEMPKMLLSLIKEYSMNSILHRKILEIFKEVYNTNTPAHVEAVPFFH